MGKKAIALILGAAMVSSVAAAETAEQKDVSIGTALSILKHLAGMKELSADEQAILDFDTDGVITIGDALVVLKSLAGITGAPIITANTGLKVNEGLLGDLGLTYSQLEQKYGKVTEAGRFGGGGGIYYVFENGNGEYMWGLDDIDGWFLGFDENGLPLYGLRETADDENRLYDAETVLKPIANSPCATIRNPRLSDLFPGAGGQQITLSEIKKIKGIECDVYGNAEMGDFYRGEFGKEYGINLIYGGHPISIYTDDKETLSDNPTVYVHLSEAYVAEA